ncbi:hypothetical protein NITLEN_20157 [Nitrospira lenta]|uniref:Uncharacterized protein n=1 Tax=Nitrospira lenta TaxID=1436998 RepID=A0A330L4B7_9BACT|nr:hypothetical protein NITLEN_20157 [Nitrospira lenta]
MPHRDSLGPCRTHGYQLIPTEPELSGALAGSKVRGRGKEGPVHLQSVLCVPSQNGGFLVCLH